MDPAQPSGDEMAAIFFRAEDLARRTVEYHRVREMEHRSRERFGRRFRPFPWSEAVAAVLSDEALEDEASVVTLIRELGRQGCSEVALAALDLVVGRGSPAPTKAMFDAAILVCATEYQDQRSLELFGRMRGLGLSPDIGTTNLVLTGLGCRGRLEAAVEVMAEMRNTMGIRPNSYSVLMVLQACNYKRRGAYREAIDAVQALEAGGRTANEEVIEALLQVCESAMHQAPSFEAALAVFSALSELHLADCTRVYNGLLGAAGRAGRWREAQALYAQMQDDDVPASLETHTALIQACVVGRALDRALHIFEHLVAGRSAHETVPASIATYNHLIHACHQAGMLEKALEIASWVQKTGVEFDDETYGELMATIDVAQLWDDKAMKQARQQHKVVLPRNLRPAPYDAMRVMYLDHLEILQQEELLAMEKLGGQGSWASKSLTRGTAGGPNSGIPPPTPAASLSLTSSARSLARSVAVGAPSVGYDIEPAYGHGYGTTVWRNGGGDVLSPSGALQPTCSSNVAASGQGPWLSQVTSGGPAAGSVAAERSAGSPRAVSPLLTAGGPPAAASAAQVTGGGGIGASQSQVQSRAASVKQLLKQLSTRPLPVLGSGNQGGVGGVSFRSALGSGGTAASPPAAASTGYHDPPVWAQVQTMDAATAGPGGTPYSAALAAAQAAGGGGGADGATDGGGGGGVPMALTLAIEPANLYSQSSAASLGGGHNRTSFRSMTTNRGSGGGSTGGPGNGVRVVLPSTSLAASTSLTSGSAMPSSALPPLNDVTSPGAGGTSAVAAATAAAAQSLVLGTASSPQSGPGPATASPPPPGRHRSRAAWGHSLHAGPPDGGMAVAAVAASADFVSSPLPSLSSAQLPVTAGGTSRKFVSMLGK
ncbi:hypothetical protein Vretimale_18626 [Volvox reticuliferus]|uniref:Pentacotripeptide-repeat region of PRORP domain-containing protein n=1 Tax=Volvox reticuliferus TaxID=1737510 RepID=A0A8J4CXU2_9CHLO|nr:hypothetical protein Vretifemale_19620 [Volvox reticuliferus]GIM15893.1 hypothetical protein Vretimale_18626 [Volvox reticuliferus]